LKVDIGYLTRLVRTPFVAISVLTSMLTERAYTCLLTRAYTSDARSSARSHFTGRQNPFVAGRIRFQSAKAIASNISLTFYVTQNACMLLPNFIPQSNTLAFATTFFVTKKRILLFHIFI